MLVLTLLVIIYSGRVFFLLIVFVLLVVLMSELVSLRIHVTGVRVTYYLMIKRTVVSLWRD